MESKKRLPVWRAERDEMSQRRLAQLAGLSEDRYWRIEKGYAGATDEEQAAIARALGVAVGEIAFPQLDAQVA